MGKSTFWGVCILVVGLFGLADVLTHPTGSAVAVNGLSNILVPTEQGLLGSVPTAPKAVTG